MWGFHIAVKEAVREKEKMLLNYIFSFSKNVLNPLKVKL